MYIFFDRTNVRSNLLLLGHLPNLVGHCPMSDSNLQPCILCPRGQGGMKFIVRISENYNLCHANLNTTIKGL
jgi:hypothetical protein